MPVRALDIRTRYYSRAEIVPSPGPTMMTGVSGDLGNDIVPLLTQTGTLTSSTHHI